MGKKEKQRRSRIGIPLSFAALIPSGLLSILRRSIAGKGFANLRNEIQGALAQAVDGEKQIEILIHLSDVFKESFGHVDLAIGDKVYSYGNYDDSKTILFGAISSGVIAVADKEKYIKHASTTENRVLIGYKLRTNRNYMMLMEAKIHEICPVLEQWDPPIVQFMRDQQEGAPPLDTASRMYRDTGCTFWKVKKRKYKYFFCLNTNCVSFADELLGVIGIDKVRASGTLSPGEYYAYLEDQLGLAGNSHYMVTQKHLYMDEERQKEIYLRAEAQREKMRRKKKRKGGETR